MGFYTRSTVFALRYAVLQAGGEPSVSLRAIPESRTVVFGLHGASTRPVQMDFGMTNGTAPDSLACTCCCCNAELGPDEDVLKIRPGPGRALVLCFGCAGPWDSALVESACCGCQRPMLHDSDLSPVCSPRCKKKASNLRAHARRAAQKAKRRCVACGGGLGQVRSDARYCGGPCRQFAYRLRLAG